MIPEPESSMVSPPIDGHYRPPKAWNSGHVSIPKAASRVCKIFITKRKAMPEYILTKKRCVLQCLNPIDQHTAQCRPSSTLGAQGQVRRRDLSPATAGVCNRTRISSSRLFLLLHSWKRVVWTHCWRHPLLRTVGFIDGAAQSK